MKLALVHDYLSQDGGAERVLRAFQEIWPEAPTYVLFCDLKRINPCFKNKDIRTSFLQKMPFIKKKYQWYLSLMPLASESHNLTDYDVILSSASAFSKGVIIRPSAFHICYCHTPTRYLWGDTYTYLQGLKTNRLVKFFIPSVLSRLRIWDQSAALRVDQFIANSYAVKKRIKKYYRRESDIIYPPVETEKFYISPRVGNFYLTGGRLVSYKRYDLVVTAFNKLGIPLYIFGEGPEYEKLKSMAKSNIRFLGKVSEREKAEAYSKCIAFLHPQEEDFGITAVEAMASGRPVIAWPKGGAMETVIVGLSGEFLEEQTWENLAGTVIRFKPESFSPEKIREHAKTFDIATFKRRIKEHTEKAWSDFNSGLRI